jgi:hypothetical protein
MFLGHLEAATPWLDGSGSSEMCSALYLRGLGLKVFTEAWVPVCNVDLSI